MKNEKSVIHPRNVKRIGKEISRENLCGEKEIKIAPIMTQSMPVRMNLVVRMNFVLTVSYGYNYVFLLIS